MALDLRLLTRNRVLGAKAETTTGTAIALAAADCALVSAIYDAKITPTVPPNERQGQVFLSKLAPVPGAQAGKLSFRSEVFGSGVAITAPTWATTLLAACGVSFVSNVAKPFTPTPSAALTTLTTGLFQAGRFRSIAGAAGTFTIIGKRGDPLMIEWEFEGAWQVPTSAAIPSPITFPTVVPPRFAGATITVGGTPYQIPEFKFQSGCKIYLREDVQTTSGYRAGIVTDRLPMLSFAPEALPLSTQDWNAAHLASTSYAFNLSVGSVAGNEFQLTAPALVLNNAPQDVDRDGLMADELEFIATRNAGDDEYSMTWL